VYQLSTRLQPGFEIVTVSTIFSYKLSVPEPTETVKLRKG